LNKNLAQTKCFFNKQLVPMLQIFMQQVVLKAPLKDQQDFFNWLLSQAIFIMTHFELTPQIVQFCLTQLPFGVQWTKQALFWWLFMMQSSLKYQGPERNLEIDMDEACQKMGLEISEEEVGLSPSRDHLVLKIGALAPMFNVITLLFKFGRFNYRKNFTLQSHCDYRFVVAGLNPFRVLVHGIKSSLNLHLNPNASYDRIRTFVSTCEAQREIIFQMDKEDRKFLKELFGSYLGKLVLSEELVQLLHRLSQVLPGDVKQHMFEACLPLKMLDVEKAGRKRSRDPSDPDSYEADCSMCRRPYPLPQLGLDAHGDPICRVCSQRFGIVIQTMLSGLPFARSGA
jgi:hypothetical protein